MNSIMIRYNKIFNKAKEHAKQLGGECLSDRFVSHEMGLRWKCSVKDHPSWRATFNRVVTSKTQFWCEECEKENYGKQQKQKRRN